MAQDVAIILVDNSDSNIISDLGISSLIVFRLEENFGIARAQNIGIDFLIEQEFDGLFFFDQDSTITKDFVFEMSRYLNSNIPQVFLPRALDFNSGLDIFTYKVSSFFGYKKINFGLSNISLTELGISSGMLVNRKAIKCVGLMDEDYFIDYVETDWFLRCKVEKIPVYCIASALMKHSIGSYNFKIFNFTFFIHPPIRAYYQIRNSFLFFRKKHVPLKLGIFEIFSTFFHYIIVLFVVRNKLAYFRLIINGFLHGIIGIKGKIKI